MSSPPSSPRDRLRVQFWFPLAVGIIVGIVVAIATGIVEEFREDRHALSASVEQIDLPSVGPDESDRQWFAYSMRVANVGDFAEERIRMIVQIQGRPVRVIKGPVVASDPDILAEESWGPTPTDALGRIQYEINLDRLASGDRYSIGIVLDRAANVQLIATSNTASAQDEVQQPYRPLTLGSPVASVTR
jgi:hypothetical protein